MKWTFLTAGILAMLSEAGCSSPRKVAPLPQSSVQNQQRAPAFGEVRMRRLRAVQVGLEKALIDWRLPNLETNCTLVFAEKAEWLVGCNLAESVPNGFETTGEKWLNQPIVWNGHPLTLGSKTVAYADVKLHTVGTVAWLRSDRSGDESPVLVLQDWDALHANHPAFQTSGVDEWIGIAVHEAFHAHQLWHPQIRKRLLLWRSISLATTDDLAAFVNANADYKTATSEEVEYLRKAVSEARDARVARHFLNGWLARRAARETQFGARLEVAMPGKRAWQMDSFYTFLEGTARYVEAKLLMTPPDGVRRELLAEPTFRNFEATTRKSATELPGLSKGGSKYVYAIGMYLSFLLDVATPDWKHHVFDSEGLLVAEVERAVAGIL